MQNNLKKLLLTMNDKDTKKMSFNHGKKKPLLLLFSQKLYGHLVRNGLCFLLYFDL